jgi:hypothetical protein
LRNLSCCLSLVALAVLGTSCEDLPPAPDVPNQPPTASFYFTPVAPIWAGQTAVAFSAINARDPDGRVVSYVWNFGDGTPEQTTTEPSVRHVFPDTAARCLNMTYGVLLAVVDDKGERGAASLGVTVTEAPAPTAAECQAR